MRLGIEILVPDFYFRMEDRLATKATLNLPFIVCLTRVLCGTWYSVLGSVSDNSVSVRRDVSYVQHLT